MSVLPFDQRDGFIFCAARFRRTVSGMGARNKSHNHDNAQQPATQLQTNASRRSLTAGHHIHLNK